MQQDLTPVERFEMLRKWIHAFDDEHHGKATEFVEEAAAALIMKARAHWFEEEQQA